MLFERLSGRIANVVEPRGIDDELAPARPVNGESTFFSTMFLERSDDAPRSVAWRQRVIEIGAVEFDLRVGTELFARLWAADPHVVTLSTAELVRFAQYFDFVAVAEGQEVIGQDEQGDYMAIVLDGTLAVDRIQPIGGRARLAEALAGDMLGEMSLLDAGERFSACTTLTPSVLAVLDAQRLDQMVLNDPRLALALLASLGRRLSLRLRQVSARLSALLSGG
jgi:CRP/FNR family transcriptional regulator, cyclic AMP receptor protein